MCQLSSGQYMANIGSLVTDEQVYYYNFCGPFVLYLGGGGRGGSRILKVVVHPKQLTVLALDLQT